MSQDLLELPDATSADSLDDFEFPGWLTADDPQEPHALPEQPERDLAGERERARRFVDAEIRYVFSPTFENAKMVEKILGPAPRQSSAAKRDLPKPPPGTPPYLAALYEFPLLSREEEHHLFRKMNFLKYRADGLRATIDPRRPQPARMDRIEALLSWVLLVRNQIIRANLRLVVSIAKKLVDRHNRFDDLLSDGNVPLMRAVEIFDFERGTRFSTYATWAIRNSLFRTVPRNRRRQGRFVSGNDIPFESASENRPSLRAQENYQANVRAGITSLLGQLDHRDRRIVEWRFGLDEDGRPLKFREIAEQLSISTERVRQLLTRSLKRMRGLAERDELDIDPDWLDQAASGSSGRSV